MTKFERFIHYGQDDYYYGDDGYSNEIKEIMSSDIRYSYGHELEAHLKHYGVIAEQKPWRKYTTGFKVNIKENDDISKIKLKLLKALQQYGMGAIYDFYDGPYHDKELNIKYKDNDFIVDIIDDDREQSSYHFTFTGGE